MTTKPIPFEQLTIEQREFVEEIVAYLTMFALVPENSELREQAIKEFMPIYGFDSRAELNEICRFIKAFFEDPASLELDLEGGEN